MCLNRSKLSLFFLLILISLAFENSAQSKRNIKQSDELVQRAMEYYQRRSYALTEKTIFSALKYDSTNLSSYLLLSDASAELDKVDQRIWALEKVIKLDSIHYTKVYKYLADIYFQRGEFSKSTELWKKFGAIEKNVDLDFVDEKIKRCTFAQELINSPLDVEINQFSAELNTAYNEYWPLIATNDSTIYFTRLLMGQKHFAYERIFFSEKIDDTWSLAQQLNIDSDEMVNVGTMSMTADARLIFFTACGRPDGKGSCDIYYLEQQGESWTRPRNAGSVINTSYWEAQAAVSASGDHLFFSSNRPGGEGLKDMWMSTMTRNEKGELKFAVPVNLGNVINTSGNDFSPFVHADDQSLYFASDGHLGLGKSDMFLARNVDSVWLRPENLGYPINSIANDDGLVVSPTAHLALFSSDRVSSIQGSKDLYQFKLPVQFQPQKVGYVKGFVFDAVSKEKLNVTIKLIDLKDNKSQELFSSVREGYITTLKAGHTYAFLITHAAYMFYSEHFNLTDPQQFSSATVKNIYLNPVQLNSKIVLNNVFFDFDSFRLKSTSLPELDEMIRFLKLNSSLRIEISGHTDNVGTRAYNEKLSADRALEIAKYLSTQISKDRITVKGYGAEKPIATNDTEAGRSQNRRTELLIIGN
ncbi:MAG: OmpA family protein [Prolixibacteraceae bacterium]